MPKKKEKAQNKFLRNHVYKFSKREKPTKVCILVTRQRGRGRGREAGEERAELPWRQRLE